jgi:hypothetical protein
VSLKALGLEDLIQKAQFLSQFGCSPERVTSPIGAATLAAALSVLNLDNYNKDGSPGSPHFTWVLLEEKKA